VKPKDVERAEQLEAGLLQYDKDIRPLPGIDNLARRDSLLEQLLESIHRIRYVSLIRTRRLSSSSSVPVQTLYRFKHFWTQWPDSLWRLLPLGLIIHPPLADTACGAKPAFAL
jgi:hypothetical protein